MNPQPLRKNKINLSDYPYQKDIEHRFLMSDLSVFEVSVLNEILHGSLKTTVAHLAEALGVPSAKLLPSLERLQKLKLYKIEKGALLVDKEQRKYYETQIPKFDDDFRADIEFLRSLLSKVPIHVLPQWYAISKTSDDIFQSIIEKYLSTPKIYQRYLDELTFDEDVLNHMMRDVFAAPDNKVTATSLLEKYKLSRETFEEYMLLLEYNMVCFLSYNQSDNLWVEVITPLHEWRNFLRFLKEQTPKAIQDPLKVVRTHPSDFGFVQDMTVLLNAAIKKPISLEKGEKGPPFDAKTAAALFPHLNKGVLSGGYAGELVKTLRELKLADVKDNALHAKAGAKAWLEKHLQEQAMMVYRYASAQKRAATGSYIDRDLKETEKCLKSIMKAGWIYFDDFVKSCTASIGEHAPVALESKGRRWRYRIPAYTEEDIATLRGLIFQTLFQSGIVATGTHDSRPCFSVTPFGRMTVD